jgi:predicted dehydrogenase
MATPTDLPHLYDLTNETGPISFAVMGCGARGQVFTDWIFRNPAVAKVIAVADPDADRRNLIADRHAVPAERRFKAWEDLLARPRLADAVINTLMDRLHAPAGIKAFDLGYHMLLEKPMAVNLADCTALDDARRRNARVASVCHSLRHHPTYREVKRLITSGAIGDVMSLDQLEGVEPVHQAHSFVRGNWGNESRSTFMLLAKSCHDIDIIMYLIDRPCTAVSSFGSLSHFTKANQPAGAPDAATDARTNPTVPTLLKRSINSEKAGGNISAWIASPRLSATSSYAPMPMADASMPPTTMWWIIRL